MSKKHEVSDAEVAAVLANLNAETSPATLEFADEPVAVTEAPVEAKQEEDDRPIVINLPAREDPSKILVAKDIPQVQALDANGNLIGVDPAALIGVTAVATPGHTVTAQTPTPPAPPAPAASEFPPGVQEVLDTYACGAWLNTDNPDKPHWTIRNGPRYGAVPLHGTVEDWRGRCAAICA